jgi:Zn-dependent M28 family amino/carboxypeptidase
MFLIAFKYKVLQKNKIPGIYLFFSKSILTIAFLFFIQLLSFSQKSALNTIDTKDLERHLTFLSSDSLQGRSFGTPINGLDIAADYLKANAKRMGLVSGADDYFQIVPIISSQTDTKNKFLEIVNTKGELMFKTDSLIGLPQESDFEIADVEIVFAGFGYKNEKSGYDDFEGVELRGKVAMFSTGTPDLFQNNESRWNNQLETEKVKRAYNAGAAGVILINSPLDEENNIYKRIQKWTNRTDFNLESPLKKRDENAFVLINSAQANTILGKKGELKILLSRISEHKKPNSFSIEELNANINVKSKTEHLQGKNIIGIVEGSDPILKNECVVFMAHYDHLGIDENGEIYNGADDNGSGIVTLLEVAEAFASLGQKPKRSIVFLWVTGEEIGMLGSQFYAENPIFPMEKTVACINIDMDGRVFEPRDTVWNKSPKMVKDFDGLYTLTNNYWPVLKKINNSACEELRLIPDYSLPSNFLRSSDHFSFHNKGVPIINYATGYHADYHKVTDEISRINFDKMKRVADLCFLVGLEIANQKKIKIPKK